MTNIKNLFVSDAEYEAVFAQCLHPSFTGYTFGTLPGRYVVSCRGGVRLPIRYVMAGNGRYMWDNAFNAVALIAARKPGYVPGVWVDGADFVFDASTSFESPNKAVAFGVQNSQDAIYDVVNDSALRIDGSHMHNN